jgi:hypothetical protein
MSQLLIVDLGWVFFAGWSTILIALAGIAFGPDIRAFTDRQHGKKRG